MESSQKMSNVTTTPNAPTEDFEPTARESSFVAVCDCDESAFVTRFGCIHV